MQNSKILVYDSAKQEAIAYTRQSHRNSLVRWAVASEPEILAEYELGRAVHSSLVGWVPKENAIAIVQFNSIWQNQEQPLNAVLELRSWEDFAYIRQIPLPSCIVPPVHLTITPCHRYAIIGGLYDYLHLVDLQENIVRQLGFQNSECPTTLVFDPQMQFFLNTATDEFSRWELHRIDDLKKGQFTRLGEFGGDIRCYYDRMIFSPDTKAFAHTWLRHGITNVVTYRTLQRSGLEQHQATNCRRLDQLDPPIVSVLWEIQLPSTQHIYDNTYPCHGDVAFLDNQTLVFSLGKALALLDTATGVVRADYQLATDVESIVIDQTHQRVIAATRDGVIIVPIAAFDSEVFYLKNLQQVSSQSVQASVMQQVLPLPNLLKGWLSRVWRFCHAIITSLFRKQRRH
jgi:hypothetical protein